MSKISNNERYKKRKKSKNVSYTADDHNTIGGVEDEKDEEEGEVSGPSEMKITVGSPSGKTKTVTGSSTSRGSHSRTMPGNSVNSSRRSSDSVVEPVAEGGGGRVGENAGEITPVSVNDSALQTGGKDASGTVTANSSKKEPPVPEQKPSSPQAPLNRSQGTQVSSAGDSSCTLNRKNLFHRNICGKWSIGSHCLQTVTGPDYGSMSRSSHYGSKSFKFNNDKDSCHNEFGVYKQQTHPSHTASDPTYTSCNNTRVRKDTFHYAKDDEILETAFGGKTYLKGNNHLFGTTKCRQEEQPWDGKFLSPSILRKQRTLHDQPFEYHSPSRTRRIQSSNREERQTFIKSDKNVFDLDFPSCIPNLALPRGQYFENCSRNGSSMARDLCPDTIHRKKMRVESCALQNLEASSIAPLKNTYIESVPRQKPCVDVSTPHPSGFVPVARPKTDFGCPLQMVNKTPQVAPKSMTLDSHQQIISYIHDILQHVSKCDVCQGHIPGTKETSSSRKCRKVQSPMTYLADDRLLDPDLQYSDQSFLHDSKHSIGIGSIAKDSLITTKSVRSNPESYITRLENDKKHFEKHPESKAEKDSRLQYATTAEGGRQKHQSSYENKVKDRNLIEEERLTASRGCQTSRTRCIPDLLSTKTSNGVLESVDIDGSSTWSSKDSQSSKWIWRPVGYRGGKQECESQKDEGKPSSPPSTVLPTKKGGHNDDQLVREEVFAAHHAYKRTLGDLPDDYLAGQRKEAALVKEDNRKCAKYRVIFRKKKSKTRHSSGSGQCTDTESHSHSLSVALSQQKSSQLEARAEPKLEGLELPSDNALRNLEELIGVEICNVIEQTRELTRNIAKLRREKATLRTESRAKKVF